MGVFKNFLQNPVIIAFMFLIGGWNVVYPSEDWNLYLGIFILIMAFVNLIQYIKRKSTKPVRPKCEYCGYIALDERELHNHQLNCEKKK